MNDRELNKIKDEITEQLETQRPYWNQCIMCNLQKIAHITSKDESNKVIRELGLEEYGWHIVK